MAKSRKQKLKSFYYLSHFYRINYRNLLIVILIILLSIFIINRQTQNQLSEFQKINSQITNDPNNPKLYAKLAFQYRLANDFENAKKNLLLALKYSNNDQNYLKQLEEIDQVGTTVSSINQEISKTYQILSQYPDYRDGWFKLAILHWQVYQDQQAIKAVNRTLEIDPNYQPAEKFIYLVDID